MARVALTYAGCAGHLYCPPSSAGSNAPVLAARSLPCLPYFLRTRPRAPACASGRRDRRIGSLAPTRTAAAAFWMGRRGARSPLPPTMRGSRRQRCGLPVEPHPLRCQAVAPGRWKAGTAGITPCRRWVLAACPHTLRMPSTRLSPGLSTPLWTTPTRARGRRAQACAITRDLWQVGAPGRALRPRDCGRRLADPCGPVLMATDRDRGQRRGVRGRWFSCAHATMEHAGESPRDGERPTGPSSPEGWGRRHRPGAGRHPPCPQPKRRTSSLKLRTRVASSAAARLQRALVSCMASARSPAASSTSRM